MKHRPAPLKPDGTLHRTVKYISLDDNGDYTGWQTQEELMKTLAMLSGTSLNDKRKGIRAYVNLLETMLAKDGIPVVGFVEVED
jgi:hypothetical protein